MEKLASTQVMQRFIIALLVMCTSFIQAQESDDEMSLNGMAEYVDYKKTFYVASLYSTWPNVSGDLLLQLTGRKRMTLKVTAKWTARRFTSQWTQAMLINGKSDASTRLEKDFIVFNDVAAGMFIPGDEIIFDTFPDGKTQIWVSGTLAHTFDNAEFFELLLGTWIGTKPPSTEFKANILSGKEDILLADLVNANPLTEGRKVEVAAWY